MNETTYETQTTQTQVKREVISETASHELIRTTDGSSVSLILGDK